MALAAPSIGAIAHVVRPLAAPPSIHVRASHVLGLHRSAGRYGLGDEEYRIDGAALMLLPAGDRGNSRLTGPDRAWWVHFDGAAVRSVRGGVELRASPAVAADAVDRLRGRIECAAGDARQSIADLARDLVRDGDALSASFRTRFGATPVAYRTRQRLQLAREILVHDPQPLAVIASRCGLSDAGYMCRVFRRHLGKSPRT